MPFAVRGFPSSKLEVRIPVDSVDWKVSPASRARHNSSDRDSFAPATARPRPRAHRCLLETSSPFKHPAATPAILASLCERCHKRPHQRQTSRHPRSSRFNLQLIRRSRGEGGLEASSPILNQPSRTGPPRTPSPPTKSIKTKSITFALSTTYPAQPKKPSPANAPLTNPANPPIRSTSKLLIPVDLARSQDVGPDL